MPFGFGDDNKKPGERDEDDGFFKSLFSDKEKKEKKKEDEEGFLGLFASKKKDRKAGGGTKAAYDAKKIQQLPVESRLLLAKLLSKGTVDCRRLNFTRTLKEEDFEVCKARMTWEEAFLRGTLIDFLGLDSKV